MMRWNSDGRVCWCVAVAAFLTVAAAFSANVAEAASPARWVKDFWPTAKAAGVSSRTYNAALGDFTPDPEVIEKASNQAEFKLEIWEYLNNTVTEKRITQGRELLVTHRALLDSIERRYGVDRHIVMAVWAMESSYGAIFDHRAFFSGIDQSVAK